MKTLFILGRQAEISLAELESLHGADAIERHSSHVALVDIHPEVSLLARLGGTTKIARYFSSTPSDHWEDVEKYLLMTLPLQLEQLNPGKIKLGFSVHGMHDVSSKMLQQTTLRIKKQLVKNGKSIRIVPNKAPTLSTAQVLHNKLTGPMGFELIISKDGEGVVHFGQTIASQDIDAYANRDQARPKRDAKVGMLPPKLAQIIVNMAVNSADLSKPTTVLDPFCGTGVVLQEANLMGFVIAGSDIDPRMVAYSDQNLMWLADQPISKVFRSDASKDDPDWRYFTLKEADALTHNWEPNPDFIACETYLGRPFSSAPKPNVLQEVMKDVDYIHQKFLKNVASQTAPGFRMCLAVPAWNIQGTFRHLKVLDSLEKLGYNRVSFAYARDEALIYHREGQIVGRELVTLIRK
ncbi:TRM11 family methyltransferase [soil metagenome]